MISAEGRPIINFGLYMCNMVYNACIHTNYKMYHAFILFGINLFDLVYM